MAKISSNELIEVVTEQLASRKEEAKQIGISDKDIGLYYHSRSDVLTDAIYEDVLRLNSDLGESTSAKSCKDTLNPILVRVLSENSKFTETDLESFLKELKSKPLITYTVLTSIYGFEMAEEYVNLGEFTIYRADSKDLRSLTLQNMEGFGKWLSYKKFTEPSPSGKIEDIDLSISNP